MRTLFRSYMIAASVLAFTNAAHAWECIADCNQPVEVEAHTGKLVITGLKCHGTVCGGKIVGMPSVGAPYGMSPSGVSVFNHGDGSRSTLTTFSNN